MPWAIVGWAIFVLVFVTLTIALIADYRADSGRP